jgi:HAD superfamily hydrolase (TIGR01509 family)
MSDGYDLQGAVFDLNGVITETTRVHFEAWKRTFEQYLALRGDGDPVRFSWEEDYLPFVNGKPRYQGVKSFLDSRDIYIPYGEPSDEPGWDTVCGIGNRKNQVFREIVNQGGVQVYEATVSFMRQLGGQGVKIGVTSSSRNARFILEATGLIELVDTVLDGHATREFGLRGKPDPDIFLVSSSNLGLNPSHCMMVEDTRADVEAGCSANYGLVVGVARHGDRELLLSHGADLVVADMAELPLQAVQNWFRKGIREDSWNLTYYGFDPSEEKLRETLTTVGNGYFGIRGCFAGERADEVIHYPGTYVAGVYNTLPSQVYRRTVYNKDLVNCPNWLLVELKIGDGEFLRIGQMDILSYRHNLDMRRGVMTRHVTVRDEEGRVTRIETERIASMAQPHVGALRYRVTPRNYSERLTIRSSLDGTVINFGVPRYRDLNSRHLSPISVVKQQRGVSLHVRTINSRINICMHAKTALYRDGERVDADRSVHKDMGFISESFGFGGKEGKTYTFEKLVSIFTSRVDEKTDPEELAVAELEPVAGFDRLLDDHVKAWERIWERADHQVRGDRFAQKVLHLHIYHLLVTSSPNSARIDWGIPARGLHGEPYRGHIFWDELFIQPFYNLHFPEIARSVLMYRCRRLDAARTYARENGFQGAMFPWQSADTGEEETQTMHYNSQSGTWGPDLSRNQRHVSLAVVYNIWSYFYCTNDLEFLHDYGLEVMLEVARFWASAARFSKKDGRYHIEGVMGPDEFHEKYTGAKKGGVRDNAYTNIMVCWLLHKTIETVEYVPDQVLRRMSEKIDFDPGEMDQWRDIVSKMNVVLSEDGILSQFDGFFDLHDIDWDYYRERYGDIHRMDRILKAEGDSPDRYQVIKQADVLQLFYLLSPGQVAHILNLMGYRVDNEQEFAQKNYDYYIGRTSHGSTLSYVVHCAILRYLNIHRKYMWDRYRIALESDVYDLQGGTTAEAVHCGVMGGTLDIVFKAFAGINIFKDHIHIDPHLPEHWERVSFKVVLRDNWLDIDLDQRSLRLRHLGGDGGFGVQVGERRHTVKRGQTLELSYRDD